MSRDPSLEGALTYAYERIRKLEAKVEKYEQAIEFAVKKIDANLERQGGSIVCVVADHLEKALAESEDKDA
jgi:hypothetical protein